MIHSCGALRAAGQTTFWALTKLHLLYTWCFIVFESKTTKQKQRAKEEEELKKKGPRLITSVDQYESSASTAWADKLRYKSRDGFASLMLPWRCAHVRTHYATECIIMQRRYVGRHTSDVLKHCVTQIKSSPAGKLDLCVSGCSYATRWSDFSQIYWQALFDPFYYTSTTVWVEIAKEMMQPSI